ncbi:MAG: tetratricopeptide repeat protein [bacterium]|nr:tetratricopeptide repeat protein [bacterium]
MDAEYLKDAAKQNWYLLVAAIAVIGVSVVGAVRAQGRGGQEGAAGSQARKSVPSSRQLGHLEALNKVPVRETPEQRTRRLIEEYRETVEAEPDTEEAPAKLNAMGNLHCTKLGEYEEAVHCYELLLFRYPDWVGARGTYLHLADCYDTLGQRDKLIGVYERMMQKYPKESQEHMYAEAMIMGNSDVVK